MYSKEEKEAIEYLKEHNIPILKYDIFGNLKKIPYYGTFEKMTILNLIEKQQKEIEELNKALMTATLKIEGLKIETVANPNMSEKEMEFGLVIQKAILTGQCDKCKYLIQCENNPDFKFPKDSWCIKNYEGDE